MSILQVRCGADEIAVAGGEDSFTVPVLYQLSSRGFGDCGHHGPGKDPAPGIIQQPLPRFRLKPVPQLLNVHYSCPHSL